MKQNTGELEAKVAAAAIVAPAPVMRAIVTAIGWLAPPPFPQRVFREHAELALQSKGRTKRNLLRICGVPGYPSSLQGARIGLYLLR